MSRVLASAALASLLLGSVGTGWYAVRFGWSLSPSGAQIEEEIRIRIATRARMVEAAALRASRHASLVDEAAASRERLPELFARLNDRGAASTEAAVTVWVGDRADTYRPLAWTDGPGDALPADRLADAPALLCVTGAGGLRLVALERIESGGRLLGVAVAEAILATAGGIESGYRFPTTAGEVLVAAPGGFSTPATSVTRFSIDWPGHGRLVDAEYAPEQVHTAAARFRWRVVAVALAPWLAVALAALLQALRRRQTSPERWGRSTAIALGVLLLATASTAALLDRVAAPAVWIHLTWMCAMTAVVAIVLVAAWWRPTPRRSWRRSPVAGCVEQLVGGALVAVTTLTTTWLWRGAAPVTVPEAAVVLLGQVALTWTAAMALAFFAHRWRVGWTRSRGWLAAALWAAPTMSLVWLAPSWLPSPVVAGALLPAGLIVFGVLAGDLRRRYHLAGEGSRLLLQLAACVAPVLLAYPLAAASIEQAIRQTIEHEYAPATAAIRQPAALMAVLTTAQAELDAMSNLAALASVGAGDAPASSRSAFLAWQNTILARSRITSEVELYGPDRRVTSRFSLNFPEFSLLTPDSDQVWSGQGCEWDAFAEVARFGAGERSLLHAERGLCEAGGRLAGAVVLHIVPDYQALPFVTSANPYYDALAGGPRPSGVPRPDVHLAVYGWSLQPTSHYGRVVWPIDAAIDDRLYASRDPFWIDREADGRRFHVYFSSDRGGIYALGYPATTPLEHATRVAEATAILITLFAAYLGATLLLTPLLKPSSAPLVRVFREVRASFYRKLFLFFVVAAVGPVVLFAVAFGAYMSDRLRDDIEFEAAAVVATARRVFDEVGALQESPGLGGAARDEVMVWIRQVVGQDVHLFDGPRLRATSQRDLFDSGLLPSRTPAAVYRDIAIDRRPVSVVEDRLGQFTYLVASTPVPALGREAILSVPLAHRQRDVDRQADDLARGVLAGMMLVVLFAAALGASVAGKVADPVARLTRATRHIAAGRLDERLVSDTADELGRLVEDFNTMTSMLAAQRAELARAHQARAWNEMARQVAHDIKNPLTPVQLAAEHLNRVHEDHGRPMGDVFDRCVQTILSQVRLLRRIASEFSTFATSPTPRFERVDVGRLVDAVIQPYRSSLPEGIQLDLRVPAGLPAVSVDRTLMARALTNLVENALQAMPSGGTLSIDGRADDRMVQLELRDTGVGMDEESVRRAFEPYFSTKTAGSGLGLANARRNVETCGGTLVLSSAQGAGTTVTLTMPVAPRDERASG